jgi:hypothetical protein
VPWRVRDCVHYAVHRRPSRPQLKGDPLGAASQIRVMTATHSSDKASYIRAFFDDLDDRVRFLAQLYSAGRQDEAVTLCCTYIDGLGNLLFWPEERTAANFTRLLREHGGNSAFSAFHLKILVRWLETATSTRLRELASKLDVAERASPAVFYSEADFRALLSSSLSPDAYQRLEKELWRGTLAFLAYDRVRIPFVHSLRGYSAVSFGESKYNGQMVPNIDFRLLFEALQSIAASTRRISLDSGRFFGHDLSRRHLQSGGA